MKKITLLILILLISLPLWAETQNPHNHGEANMAIELTAQTGVVSLEMAGADFIGLEKPEFSSEEKEELLEFAHQIELEGRQLLTARVSWFRVITPDEVHVHMSLHESGHDGEDNDGEDHDGEDHDGEDHDGEDHDGEEHGHESDHHDDEEGHKDYIIEFHFSIDDKEEFKQLDTSELFEFFPSLEKINWIMISNKGQQGGQATPSSSKIKF